MIGKGQDVPRFNVQRILKIKSRIFETLAPYCGQQFNADRLGQARDDLVREFPFWHYDSTLATLYPLSTAKLTVDDLDKFSLRLGANCDSLLSGEVVLPFTALAEPTWAVVEIIRSRPDKHRAGRPSGRFLFKVLTGPAAGQEFDKILSVRQQKLISRFIGFNRRGLKAFDGIRASFFKLRLVVKLNTVNGELDFDEFDPKKCQSYNRKIITERTTKPCPKGFTTRCSQCAKGQDECPRGCRLNTLEDKYCPKCDRTVLFDGDECLSCYQRMVYGRERREAGAVHTKGSSNSK